MFPEFVTIFRDKDNKVHLFVFPGLDKDNNLIYKKIDLGNITCKYSIKENNDESYEIIFDDNIKSIACNMKHYKTNDIKTYFFKDF